MHSLHLPPPHATSPSIATSLPAIPDDDDDDDLPPSLRFGDLPLASSFPERTPCRRRRPAPPPPFALPPPEISPQALSDAALVKKRLFNRCASPPIRGCGVHDLELLGADSFPTIINDICCGGGGVNASCLVSSPRLAEGLLAFKKFLPSNVVDDDDDEIWSGSDSWPSLDIYSCDDFRMYEFKVRKCVRGRSHDWTECPFAHPGEKARRRDPRRYRYSGTACPDFRKGNCRRGEACEYSHGVFECWLHPMRYRTQPCKDGRSCRRRICFFAHTPEQLRIVTSEGESPPATPRSGSSSGGSTRSSLLKAAAMSGEAYDGSPLRRALASTLDGSVALEFLLDDSSSKSSPAACLQHHWLGSGNSSVSTLEGSPAPESSPTLLSSLEPSPASSLMSYPGSWTGVPAHRRHLDRLRSTPTISIPAAGGCGDSPPQRSPRTMAELMSTLESLQLSPCPMTASSCRTLPSCSNAWPILMAQQHLPSRSAPNTPKSRYLQVRGVLMERGRAFHGVSASSNEVVAELDAPDLEWVNELVQ